MLAKAGGAAAFRIRVDFRTEVGWVPGAAARGAGWRNRDRAQPGPRFRVAPVAAASGGARVKMLAQMNPASIVFFDLLAKGSRDYTGEAFATRRRELERVLRRATPPIHLTPATTDPAVAADWFRRFEGAGLDGVMAGFRWDKKGGHAARNSAGGAWTKAPRIARTRSWKWCPRKKWRRFFRLDGRPSGCHRAAPLCNGSAAKRAGRESVQERAPRPARYCRHSRVGSSSGSGVSCGGRICSGTWRRFTRMRVQVEDRPRMESTRTSSMASRAAVSGCLCFHRSRPASAASFEGELATTISGIF